MYSLTSLSWFPGNHFAAALYIREPSSDDTCLSDRSVGELCGPVDLWSRKSVLQLFELTAEHVAIERK